jgi:hypothetical protein
MQEAKAAEREPRAYDDTTLVFLRVRIREKAA